MKKKKEILRELTEAVNYLNTIKEFDINGNVRKCLLMADHHINKAGVIARKSKKHTNQYELFKRVYEKISKETYGMNALEILEYLDNRINGKDK